MKKNKTAQNLAQMRWSKTTKEERSEHARSMARARWAKKHKYGWKKCKDEKKKELKKSVKRAIELSIVILALMGISSSNMVVYATQDPKAPETLDLVAKTVYVEPAYTEVDAIISYYTASVDECNDDPCHTADMTWVCPAQVPVIANNCLEFGTRVEIDGKIYEVHDRMNKRYACDHFDILVESKAIAYAKGVQNLNVKIYEK